MSEVQHQATALMAASISKHVELAISPVGRSYYSLCIVVLLVFCLHVAALATLLHRSSSAHKIITPPTISGVLIEVPQTNIVKAPKVIKAEPSIQPHPVPAPKPPLSAKAITLSESSVEPSQPEVVEAPVVAESSKIPLMPVDGIKTKKEKVTESPIAPPRLDATRLNNPAPVYPRTSLRLRQEGTVILKLLILANGTVGEIKVKISSRHQRLDKAALKAVKRWQYVPSRRKDEAIDFWYEQPIVFSLRQ